MTYEYVEKKYGLTSSQINDWKSLLGDLVLQGEISLSKRSSQLLPDHHPDTLRLILSENSEFKQWYSSVYQYGKYFVCVNYFYHLDIQQFIDWKKFLSPVINGNYSLEGYSKHLFPDLPASTLAKIYKTLKIPSYFTWRSNLKVPLLLRQNKYSKLELISSWKDILGIDVLNGTKSVMKRSMELFPDLDCNFLFNLLSSFVPKFNIWYKNASKGYLYLGFLTKFSDSDLESWQDILGPKVMSGEQSIASRSIELFPDYSDTLLLYVLRNYAPESFQQWYKDYHSPILIYKSILENELLKRFNFISFKSRHRPSYTIDLYEPKRNIGFELNGYYWHSLGHEDSSVNCRFSTPRMYHSVKTSLAFRDGIKLYHLWYKDSRNDNSLIISFINSKLGIFKQCFFARKLSIREITPAAACSFYDENHLQGSPCKSGLKSIGLCSGDLLISCMSFNLKHQTLIRYASLKDVCVVGGFSRLFKNAVKLFGLKQVITWGNRDIIPDPYDNVYIRHGFKLINEPCGKSQLQMQYYLSKRVSNYQPGVYSRQTFQKKKLLEMFSDADVNQSETEIAIKHGIYPCYNSGTWKFLWSDK